MKTTTIDNKTNTKKRESVRYNNINKAFNKLFKSWRSLGFSYEESRDFASDQINEAKHLNMIK